jgi:DNA-binding MarR family transcriptional regulator
MSRDTLPRPERRTTVSANFPDMWLLHEVTESPQVTQRDLSRRIGMALGLTNLILRRLINKGFIKIVNVEKSRIRYLITPRGMMEKARLTREYIEYSLLFYRSIREFLTEHFARLAQEGHRRVLLCGTGELAEIAWLTMQQVGLELVGVIDEAPDSKPFLGRQVRRLGYAAEAAWDRIVVASLAPHQALLDQLASVGIEAERCLLVPQPGKPLPPLARDAGSRSASTVHWQEEQPPSLTAAPSGTETA